MGIVANINVPEISTGKLVERVTAFYAGMMNAGVPCHEVRPVMLFGPTGVGKSSAVMQVADRLKQALGREVEVVDIRLTSCTITDLIGIPVPDKDRKGTIWLKPEIYKQDADNAKNAKEKKIFIYFFDELDKASPAIQAAALQLILDRKAWVHNFPEFTFVIAAANPARGTTKYETRMAPELMNRFKHFNVQPDFDSFRVWGIREGLHPLVLGYLSYDNSKLYAASEGQDIAFPTPRSWKSISDLLKVYEGRYKDMRDLHYDLAGEIGSGTALDFEGYCNINAKLPNTDDIFHARAKGCPNTMDVLSALIASMTTYVQAHLDTIDTAELTNAGRYLSHLGTPKDFLAMYYKNLQSMLKDSEHFKQAMQKEPTYLDWTEE